MVQRLRERMGGLALYYHYRELHQATGTQKKLGDSQKGTGTLVNESGKGQ